MKVTEITASDISFVYLLLVAGLGSVAQSSVYQYLAVFWL